MDHDLAIYCANMKARLEAESIRRSDDASAAFVALQSFIRRLGLEPVRTTPLDRDVLLSILTA